MRLGMSPKADESADVSSDVIHIGSESAIFKQGMRVESPKFGEGIILRSEMVGGYEKVTVQFSLYGIKKLVANFAQLKKL
jgi:hypothetical protein